MGCLWLQKQIMNDSVKSILRDGRIRFLPLLVKEMLTQRHNTSSKENSPNGTPGCCEYAFLLIYFFGRVGISAESYLHTKAAKCIKKDFRSLQRCLIGSRSGFWLVQSRTFIDLSLRHLSVVLAVCLESCWTMNLQPCLSSWELWFRL